TGPGGGGASVPVSLGPVFESILKPLQLSITTVKAQETGDTVVAPALVINGVLPQAIVEKAGATGNGSYTMAFGEATARLSGQAAPPAYTPPPPNPGGGAAGGGSTGGSTG